MYRDRVLVMTGRPENMYCALARAPALHTAGLRVVHLGRLPLFSRWHVTKVLGSLPPDVLREPLFDQAIKVHV